MAVYSLLHIIEAEYRKLLQQWRLEATESGQQNTKAMKLTLRTRLDYDVEDGHRELEILLYTPQNYTAVCVRNKWSVAPIDDEAAEYVDGNTDFLLRYYHDSCWGEGLRDALETPGADISTSFDSWYEIVEFDLELGNMKEIYHVSDLNPLTFKFSDKK